MCDKQQLNNKYYEGVSPPPHCMQKFSNNSVHINLILCNKYLQCKEIPSYLLVTASCHVSDLTLGADRWGSQLKRQRM